MTKIIGYMKFHGKDLRVVKGKYATGLTAIFIEKMGGAPEAKLSTCVSDVSLPEDHFLAKTWGENERISVAAMSSGLFEDTGARFEIGYCVAEVWKIV